MEYSPEQIREFADIRVSMLMDDEYLVESLPNDELLYFGALEDEYSEAVRNTNPNSRLLTAVYED